MAGRSRGCVYRPVVTTTLAGKRQRRRSRYYWAKYCDAAGLEARHALKLPNGQGITDKAVAQAELRKLLNRVEREAAGLVDHVAECASTPLRGVIARYVRHLRRKRCGRAHIKQVLCCFKWIMDKTAMRRLADFDEEHIDTALGMLADLERSPRTINVYRNCALSMGEWAVTVARMIDRNPVRAIGRRNESTDVRKVRRSLTMDQAYRLLDCCGPRAPFYSVQLWAGLRVAEVAALQWRDLDLDGERPCINLRAEATKSGRADQVPLHPDLAAALREARPPFAQPVDSVFQTTPILRTFKRDLDRAKIPFADEHGRTVDRHALRTTFISWLGACGVDPRAQIKLARHVPRGITFRNYQDFGVFDLSAEMAKLPGFRNRQVNEAAKATGTDDARPGAVVPPVVPTSVIHRQNVASAGKPAPCAPERAGSKKRPSGGQKRGFRGLEGLGDTGLEPVTSCVSSNESASTKVPLRCHKRGFSGRKRGFSW